MGYKIIWEGCTAYVGETGKVEGVDGDMWACGRPLWVVKRMLNNKGIAYTIEECEICLMEKPKGKKAKEVIKTIPKKKRVDYAPEKEPECKS